MKNVLIISYYFPPYNNIAARRYGQMVEYFGEHGWRPWVITTHSEGDLPIAISDKQVIRVGQNLQSMSKFGSPSGQDTHTSTPTIMSSLISKVMPKVTQMGFKPLTYDRTEQWVQMLSDQHAQIMRQLPKIDLVLSTVGPSCGFNAGLLFKRLTNAPAILDFRDMAGFLDKNKRWVIKKFDRFVERKAVSGYDALVTVSPTLQEILALNYHKPTHVILNGWYPSDITDTNLTRSDYVYFAGRIYDHHLPSLQILLQALTHLPDTINLKVRSLSVDWINLEFLKMVHQCNLQHRVELLSPCSAEQAQQEASVSMVNLILEDLDKANPWSKGTLTGKLMQLMPLPPPLLSIARSDNDMRSILIQSARGQLCSDVDSVIDFLHNVHSQEDSYPLDLANIDLYSKAEQTKKLCVIMDGLTSASDTISPYSIFDCPCYPVTEDNIDEAILSMVQRDQAGYAVAINAEKLYRFQQDSALRQTISSAVFPYPDGAGAVLGLKLLHKMPSEKINMPIRALETANKHRLKVFIVGAKPDAHDEAINIIQQRYSSIDLVGNMHGYHDQDEIKQAIIKTEPQLIMLALGSPRQEHFAASLVPDLAHGFVIGCGGALDIIAGRLKRAPEFWINNNLEWLYRLIQEPWRWRRQMFLPVFYLRLLKVVLKTRLFGKAAS